MAKRKNDSILILVPKGFEYLQHKETFLRHFGLEFIRYYDPSAGIDLSKSTVYIAREEIVAKDLEIYCRNIKVYRLEDIAADINAKIPLTEWRSDKPTVVGEYITSRFRDSSSRRWWNGEFWSRGYKLDHSEFARRRTASIKGLGQDMIEWIGLAEKPIVIEEGEK